ncbi:helix-turn-helix transcriptional regulator [Saccharopolyspora sp. HNM0983]|uniref:Helix-turn-helix transcriptional regulator n=1 Tax=Saccharopolyspora montiporae TaxID=2781240 RepID=A0A929B656_9PSEU|nr:helix-turn-helix transcriptional regulator [Saccharopolyspora sp. HNM0983]MBE9372975.1 helix-turn-helix transcriptional regulator [Saccharopolyspora sp. HNM0983]
MATRRDSLAARREALGLSQEALARELDVELSTVGRWERGTLTPQPRRRPELARALHISLDALAGLLNPAPSPDPPAAARATNRHPDTASRHGSLPDPPTAGNASDQVDQLHRAYQAARYDDVRRLLPSVTTAVDELVAQTAQPTRHALSVRCSLHIVTAKLATKVGNHAEAGIAAERARTAAETAEDTFGQAAAAYQRTCALLRTGDVDDAEQVAASAASSTRSRDPQSVTWRGVMMLIGAVIAARRNDATEAGRRLDHAEELARLLGADANIGWTAFGPTNVLIHRSSVAVALGDPRTALNRADQIDVTRMPVGLNGRQARFHLDNAWAHTQLGEDPEAVIHLLDTERVAPELMRTNPGTHRLIHKLLTRERRYRVPGLRELAHRAGVAA